MKVFLHYQDNDNSELHKSLKLTLPKSWKHGPVSKLLGQFVESYNSNDTLGSANPLKVDHLHLALQGEESNGASTWEPLASDSIAIEAIPDRADVYILHGPSQTLQQKQDKIEAEQTRRKEEQRNTVACTHFGCKQRFRKGGPYPDCSYHKSPPIFHETAKYWSCCPQKKAYDWTEFESIPGCCVGVCTEVKEDQQKQFLGGTDLREQLGGEAKLKSIDDFNKAHEAGGSDAAPVMDRLRSVMGELDIEAELFDQVVEGLKHELEQDAKDDAALLAAVAKRLGETLKATMKSMAAEQLRIK